ncbi:tyrosine-type recombinase/integrase [Tunturiibacter gelidoferens]|uniref:tyrosine-type recombinase/integrase n=1 Tax=Tunturiibacter gelidiferens TaxID=3069689 RepID=UPI003342B5A9
MGSEGEDRVFHWLAAETGLRSGELAGLRLSDIDGERLTVNHSVWLGREQAGKTNNAIRSLALSPQLRSLLWEQIARQRAKGHEYLFSSKNGKPRDMNVYRRRKMIARLKSSGDTAGRVPCLHQCSTPQRHAEDDQERIGHALTGSYPLDVHGGQPEWGRNLETAQHLGAGLREPLTRRLRSSKTQPKRSLITAYLRSKKEGSGADIS